MVRTRDCADMVRQKRLGEALTSAMALVMSVSHAMSKEERGGVPSLMSLPLPFSRAVSTMKENRMGCSPAIVSLLCTLCLHSLHRCH